VRRTAMISLAGMVALGLSFGLAGCSEAEKQADNAKRDIAEFAIRNAAAIAGTETFKEKGAELKERLDCTADVTSDNTATLSCTGTTLDGRPVTLDGTADDDTAEKGSFVGKVDGQELFSKDCLDCS
jgi:hypothetical protein